MGGRVQRPSRDRSAEIREAPLSRILLEVRLLERSTHSGISSFSLQKQNLPYQEGRLRGWPFRVSPRPFSRVHLFFPRHGLSKKGREPERKIFPSYPARLALVSRRLPIPASTLDLQDLVFARAGSIFQGRFWTAVMQVVPATKDPARTRDSEEVGKDLSGRCIVSNELRSYGVSISVVIRPFLCFSLFS